MLVSILVDIVSEMTYTVSSGTLNPSIPYHTILVDMEILTRAQRKTIIQTQFVSVVSKVISDGIFNERF